MDEGTAEEVVELLRAKRIFATVNRRAGVYNVGVRVVIPGGREAIWDNDGAAGLEAMVLRDGVLVGFVPQIPDSDGFDAAATARVIAEADYDAPPSGAATTSPPSPPAAAPADAPPPPAPPPAAAADATRPPAAAGRVQQKQSWRDRLRRR